MIRGILAVTLSCVALSDVWAAGDPEAGKRPFAACSACHSLAQGEPDRIGPNLHGVVGRPAAAKPGFAYSDVLKQSGIVWTDDNLLTWIKKPSALLTGSKMVFAGVANPETQENILAYLKEATK